MNTAGNTRAFRWLFLFWVGVVYLWGIWGGTTVTSIYKNKPIIVMSGFHLSSYNPLLAGDWLHTGLFTLLMLLYSVFLWIGLSGKIARRLYWLYFLGQGGLVLACSLALYQVNLALNLYLALTLAAIVMLKQPRLVISVALECVLLFLVAVFLETMPWRKENVNPFFWEIALSTLPGYLATILFVVGYILLYLQQTRAQSQLGRAYTELETAHTRLVVSAERIAELTRLTERQRLARELHDTLAQGLAGLLLQLEAIHAGLLFQRYPEALEMVEQSLSGARTALADARDAIGDLRASDTTPGNLATLVQQEITRFTEATGVHCHAELSELASMPAPLCEQVQRVTSEGLTNIARHARASNAWIKASRQDGKLNIEIGDDGIGFDPAHEAARAGHYGLLGLRERARIIGGSCEIESAPGEGTVLFLRIPLTQSEPIPNLRQAADIDNGNARQTVETAQSSSGKARHMAVHE